LTIRLSLRKRSRKLIANSKGFSSVIGTTFMVLVMMFLSTSVFLWTLSQNTLYNEALRARNQEEADRRNENVVALSGNYSVSGEDVTVKVVLKNAGSVASQIINLWVLDTDPSNRRYANKSLNLNLNPGVVLDLVTSSWLTVTIPGANANHTFTSWFVTARGNTIPLEKEQGVIVAQLAQGIGSLALDFYKFRYFEYESATKLKNYPNGNVGFTVPANQYIAFGCSLTNLDPGKQAIVFDPHSLLWVIVPTSDVPHSTWWYIVNVVQDGTINATYSPISLAYGETKMIIFASANDLGLSSFSRQTTPKAGLPAPVFLLLHGNIGGIAYGQNLPFVSLYFA